MEFKELLRQEKQLILAIREAEKDLQEAESLCDDLSTDAPHLVARLELAQWRLLEVQAQIHGAHEERLYYLRAGDFEKPENPFR